MTDADRWLTLQSIREHEGFSATPAPDTNGTWVVGFGWNPQRLPITKGQADALLESQVIIREADLQRAWPTYALCDGPRQRALLEISYQIGVSGLMGFTKMLHAIAIKDFQTAAQELKNSGLYRQTPKRGDDYIALLEE